jgi:hypothetical protein
MSLENQFKERRWAELRHGPPEDHDRTLGPIRPLGLLWAALLTCLALAPALQAQVNYEETNVTVTTIGGGPPPNNFCASPAGFVDGSTLQQSQFDGPVALALNSQATLFIADKTNNAVRMVTSVGDTASSATVTSPILTNLHTVVGVAVDAADNLYVLTQSNNAQGRNVLRKYNYSLNLLFSNLLPYSPCALAVSQDSATNIFIAFTNGMVLKYGQSNAALAGPCTIVGSGSNLKPGGIAWRSDGVLAVSDLASNAIYRLAGTNNSVPILYAGGGANGSTPGWVDGVAGYAEFNQPAGLTWSPDGQLVVADRANNAVRRIDASQTTSTIYGVQSALWGSSDCSEGLFAGWVDGAFGPYQTNATGDAPTSVLVAPSGTIYVTELGYDLLREVNGVAFAVSTNGGTNGVGSTNGVLSPPAFSPNSGYFTECQTITVSSSVSNVFYTTDGTTPTTNSPMVQNMVPVTTDSGQTFYEGSLQWCNSLLDLSSLQLLAANGTNVSAVTNGLRSSTNLIGFPSSHVAGVGSTAVIPVVVNLQPNTTLASVQFDLEIVPNSSATPPILPGAVSLLNITTNDYHLLVAPTQGNLTYEKFTFSTESNGLGLAVLEPAGGTNLLNAQNFAVLALLEVAIPTNAVEGQSYTLNFLYEPSGTSNGLQGNVPLTAMPMQTLTISNYLYFEGDSSPANGYSAGEFGDGTINNSDVNNAFKASLGIYVPFQSTDAFSAMDVYPETATEIGDGFITFLDWQHILFRSLGLETNSWIRFWTDGGTLSHKPIVWLPGDIVTNGISPSQPFEAFPKVRAADTPQPGAVWLRQASIHAGTIAGLSPGLTYSIPVYVNVLPGYSLAGLQFRATLVPNGTAPAPGQIQFAAAPGLPPPYASAQGLSPNDIIYAWSLFEPFTPPLQGSKALGSISFQVPGTAQNGQSYTLRFSGEDGSPDLDTLYQLESVPGTAWVGSAALTPPQISSDEWRMCFFGSLTNALAQDTADPDGDGMLNWQEYLAGTNPTNALSALQFLNPAFASGAGQDINLSWLTAPGRNYVLESSATLTGPQWTAVNTNLGDGNTFQFSLTNKTGGARFFRIRLQP